MASKNILWKRGEKVKFIRKTVIEYIQKNGASQIKDLAKACGGIDGWYLCVYLSAMKKEGILESTPVLYRIKNK